MTAPSLASRSRWADCTSYRPTLRVQSAQVQLDEQFYCFRILHSDAMRSLRRYPSLLSSPISIFLTSYTVSVLTQTTFGDSTANYNSSAICDVCWPPIALPSDAATLILDRPHVYKAIPHSPATGNSPPAPFPPPHPPTLSPTSASTYGSQLHPSPSSIAQHSASGHPKAATIPLGSGHQAAAATPIHIAASEQVYM
jgi:hypothetical protein